jgi:hypothetical protein
MRSTSPPLLRVSTGPQPITLDLGRGVEYRYSVAVIDGLPAVTSLTLTPTDGPLRPQHLRVPLTRLATLGAQWLHGTDEPTEALQTIKTADQPEGRDWGNDHYRQVAVVVAEARAKGQPTYAAVAEHWHPISRHTADAWIRKARKLGYITGDLRRRHA